MVDIADSDVTNMVACQSCSDDVPEDEAYAYGALWLCGDCMATCNLCEDVTTQGRATRTGYVCHRCAHSQCVQCPDCGLWTSEYTYVGGIDANVCELCLESYYWCEDCEQYYSEECTQHNRIDCCVAPHLTFTFPNDGEDDIANDELATVTLPAGVIDEVGQCAIAEVVYYALSSAYSAAKSRRNFAEVRAMVNRIEPTWMTKQGAYTKRIARLFWSEWHERLSPGMVSEIGNAAQRHTASESSYAVTLTRDLNLPAADFVHAGSCWWTSYGDSRCAFKQCGGLGLRTWSNGVGCDPTGRAWIMPLERDGDAWTPTHDTHASAYAVFNAYGDIDGIQAARIVSRMTGLPVYRKVSLTAAPMYVNGAVAYLVADAETCANTDALDVPAHLSEGC